MKCPVDNATLIISDRNNIEIDYCPDCRGVWLDRGELDKIIERSEALTTTQYQQKAEHREDQHHYEKPNYYDKHYKKKRKDSFLGDMFDF